MSDIQSEETRNKLDGTGRDKKGRLLPGHTSNKNGRPPVIRHIRELAREQTETAFAALVAIAMYGESESARVAAIREILDRGWGKSTQFFDTPEQSNIAAVLSAVFGGQHIMDVIRNGDDDTQREE